MLKTASDFIREIEDIAREKKISNLDALMFYVEKHNVEPETIAAVVRKNAAFKARLYEECSHLNLVEKKT